MQGRLRGRQLCRSAGRGLWRRQYRDRSHRWPGGLDHPCQRGLPRRPDRMMTFVFWDQGADRDLSYVELAPDTVVAGIADGMSVDEIEALNGAPFVLSGFWWDYGGYADFSSGQLANLPG